MAFDRATGKRPERRPRRKGVPINEDYDELGLYFAELRERCGWTVNHAAQRARDAKLKRINRSQLIALECGWTKNPTPAVLREVAILYSAPYTEILAQVEKARSGVALSMREGEPVKNVSAGTSRTAVESATSAAGADTEGGAYFEHIAAHGEQLIRLAQRIVEFGDLGEELKQIAVSLAAGYSSGARTPSTARARNARKARARVRRTTTARSAGK